jgi:zinc transport system ATP-binding protein
MLLELDSLRAGYDRPVVGPLSMQLHAGEVVGLWGANGSGKSTLLAAIGNGARIFSGEIRRAPGLRVAYQEQRPVRLPAMPFTGRDLLRISGAKGSIAALPATLRDLLDRRVDRLSGGQYQLLCVWAALGRGAELIMLDEPTNNLDPAHEALLAEMLSRRSEERAVLLVSHERSFLDGVCNRVLELST